MVKAGDVAIISGALLGMYVLYNYLAPRAASVPSASLSNPDKTQIISTSGVKLNYRPRTSYVLGNSGSVREITRAAMPEDHGRGEAVLPFWRRYGGSYGSVMPNQVTGTFNGKGTGLTIPEEVHVTPQLESRLAASVRHRLWETGGSSTPEGTFG